MLTFIEGGFHSDMDGEIMERIRKNVTAGKKTLLIVPEQQTVSAEIEAAEALPSFAPLSLEVTNFTRLANSAFRALGGIHLDYATSEKKTLIMWKTLLELAPVLSLTRGRKDITVGTVERAMRALGEAHSLGLDASEMKRLVAEKSLTPRLAEKLSDLEAIRSLYKSTLNERYSDTEDDIALLIEKLNEFPEFLSDTDIFIQGFTSFTASQYSLIGVLTDRSSVTVGLVIPKSGSTSFEYSEVARTRSRLSVLADRCGSEKRLVRIDGTPLVKSELLRDITPLLWKANAKIVNNSLHNYDDLRVFEAKNPFEECEFIASDIRKRVLEGASYKDIAIITADAARYDGILDAALEKAEIPYFSSYKTRLCEFEAIKLIFSALKAAMGFARDDVLAYASCGLSGISYGERDEFAMYVERWGITKGAFTDEVKWGMNPDGFDGRKSADADELLSRIDATRVKLITPLAHLAAELSGEHTVREQAESLFSFLTQIELEKNLSLRAKRLFDLGFGAAAEENSRLFSVICDALDTAVEVLGDTVATADSFGSILRIIFSETEIGRIPASYDEVMTGSADMLRLSGKKYVYLFGVNYGEFPKAPRGVSYFSDKDREILSSLGIEADSSQIEGARSLYSFQRAFSYASEGVTVSYSLSDASFGSQIPSFVISNIENLTDKRVRPVRICELSAQESLFSPAITEETLSSYTESEQKAAKDALLCTGHRVISERSEVGNGMLSLDRTESNGPLYLTQTRIDTFVSCPLQHFCKFTLSLGTDERAEFGASSIGSYVHAILENFFSEVKSKGIDVAALSEQMRAEMTERAAKKYLSGFESELGVNSARMKMALLRILRAARPVVDGLCEEFTVSGFTPAFFELKIDKSGEGGPSPVMIRGEGGEKIYVYGTIDRVDTMQRDNDVYVRVVDYKTGAKEFRPSDIKDGKNLQMFLYLKSILECEKPSFREALGVKEGGNLIGAGLIYVKTEIKDQRVKTPSDEDALNAVKASQKRMGMILDDSEIYLAMGKEYIPIRLTKNGVDKRTEQYLYTPERWEEISREVEDVVGKIGHRISRGDIRSITGKEKQKKSPCEWCQYKAFCRNIKL